MAKKIDPLNKKNYGAVSVSVTVTDMQGAAAFYKQAFGFKQTVSMKGPDGKPMHIELRLRDTSLMLSAENPQRGNISAKTLGNSPVTLYLLSENTDKTVAKAVKLGATQQGPVMDMFWGDRTGNIVDPQGYKWMIATHQSEPTPAEMKKAMKAMMAQMAASSGGQ